MSKLTYPIIYYINLEHRIDRKKHILGQLKQMDYPIDRVNRIDAVKHEFGGLGCSRSHIKTLETFLSTDEDRCIVLEDDFTFFPNMYDSFHHFIVHQKDLPDPWDIIMLSSNTIQEMIHSSHFTKCINAQTTSGYMIKRDFAKRLVENFKEGESLLSKTFQIGYEVYGLDQYWKRMQPSSHWYICKPKIGHQLDNDYSDIERRVVSYGV